MGAKFLSFPKYLSAQVENLNLVQKKTRRYTDKLCSNLRKEQKKNEKVHC